MAVEGEASAGGQHLVAAGGLVLQHLGEPFGDEQVHFLRGELGGGELGFLGRPAHGAAQHLVHQPAEQHPVAHPQGVEITLHLGVGGVPFVQRATGHLAGLVGGRIRGQGGLQ
jgi:hypothetical protein